jgi:hypothetical protein
MKRLEEVFKRSGIPTYTFVEPEEYRTLLVSIRTHGRGTIVEGPSGIGKTTSVLRVIESIKDSQAVMKLSGRNPDDYDLIAALPEMGDIGIVVIDDFHRLPDSTKSTLADYIKLLADREDTKSKVIIVGINKAGQSLLNYASDLTGRIDTITFETNPEYKIEELINLGESALNISINIKKELIYESQGSFHLAQMLCHECCIEGGILEEKSINEITRSSIEVIKERVLNDLSKTFFEKSKLFATGPRLRKEGRAPYFYLLHWLASEKEWTLNVADAIRKNPKHRGSVGQIVDKGYLADHIQKNSELEDVIHFDTSTRELSIEDPKFAYFLRNLLWSKFCEKVGYRSVEFDTRYDYALSFAGADRDLAEGLFKYLTEAELSVFYDKNEQYRILASNVEDYLAPIYKTEASFVIALLGKEYPKRIWTKFESEQFKERFGKNAVIPIWFTDSPPGMFDETAKYGGVMFDRGAELETEILRIGDLLRNKILEYKEQKKSLEPTDDPSEELPISYE